MPRIQILAIGVVLLAASGAAADLVLAERGRKPSCSIVLPATHGPSERYAAEELCDWTERLTGVRLTVAQDGEKTGGRRIFINKADPGKSVGYGDDEFELKVVGNDLLVSGGSRGVLYGVYELLETYGGVLWLSPDYTHVPKANALTVPKDLAVREKPDFAFREQSSTLEWSVNVHSPRIRCNRITFFEKYGGAYPPFDSVLGNCHTFGKLVPASRYFGDHPEYFSFFKGKRQNFHSQLCLTNPEVFEIVLAGVIERIEANKAAGRKVKYYGVSQDDWNGYCECPDCAAIDEREGSHAGCIIWFVNKIAEAVEKKYPDVVISTLAYMYSRVPPKTIRPRGNVQVVLCTIECDMTKPTETSRNSENAAFRENLLKWKDLCDDLYLWDYIANWRASPSPQPNLRAMAKNIRFFRDAGVKSLYQEGIFCPSANFSELKGWLSAKLMWKADRPVAPLIAEFVNAYYGKAAPSVLKYIRLLESFPIDEAKETWTYARTVLQLPFDEAFYDRALQLWQEATEAVRGEPEAIREHVDWGRFGIEYTLAARYALGGAWRPYVVSQAAAAGMDGERFLRCRGFASDVMAMLARAPKAMVSSRLNDARMKGLVRALAEAEPPTPENSRKALVQDWAFDYCDFPKSKTISRTEDADATDGKAIAISHDGAGWKVKCKFKELVALDEGATYRLRVRLKVRSGGGAGPTDELVRFALLSGPSGAPVAQGSVTAACATGDYTWYDAGSWTADGSTCQFCLDPRDADLSLDCLEIEKVTGHSHVTANKE